MKQNAFILSILFLAATALPFSATAQDYDVTDDMAAMQEMTSPGDAHEIFKGLTGDFTYQASFKMTSDAAPAESGGTSSHALIYGGRYLQETVQGEWMGQQFTGTSIMGFDNIRQEYVSIWYDNMMTGISTMTGQYDPDTQILEFYGTNSCPMTGETDREVRAELILSGPNPVYRTYMYDENGEEFMAMEIVYAKA